METGLKCGQWNVLMCLNAKPSEIWNFNQIMFKAKGMGLILAILNRDGCMRRVHWPRLM